VGGTSNVKVLGGYLGCRWRNDAGGLMSCSCRWPRCHVAVGFSHEVLGARERGCVVLRADGIAPFWWWL